MDSLKVEAGYARCRTCSKPLDVDHRVSMSYRVKDIEAIEHRGELGLLRGQMLLWTHISCEDPKLERNGWHLTPSVQHDIQTGDRLAPEDLVQTVYRVIHTVPDMILSDRFYFLRRKNAA